MIRSNQDSVLVVGKSEATCDWTAYQPGSANEPAGYRQHPFLILFDFAGSSIRPVHVEDRGPFLHSPHPAASGDLNGH
jgi:hypothetical protein